MLTEKIQKLLDNRGGNYILPFFWQHGEEEAVRLPQHRLSGIRKGA